MNAPDKLAAADATDAAGAEPHVMKTYGRLPVALSHGQGCWLWDTEGKQVPRRARRHRRQHARPRPPASSCRRCSDQVAKLIHSSNYYLVPLQEQLAAKLCELSGLTNVFFCNSGLEANEAALKIARKYGHDKGIERPEIVVYESGLPRPLDRHAVGDRQRQDPGRLRPAGRGLRARAAQRRRRRSSRSRATNPNVVAVFLEVIQGEGGIRPTTRRLPAARCAASATSSGWLLMLDEVQCGMGRTGKWFAHQWAGIRPDVMPLAKGLGSGVPIGAVVCGPRAAGVFGPGNHGTTFGGNPLAMRAGVETLRIMEEDGLLANAAEVGELLKAASSASSPASPASSRCAARA